MIFDKIDGLINPVANGFALPPNLCVEHLANNKNSLYYIASYYGFQCNFNFTSFQMKINNYYDYDAKVRKQCRSIVWSLGNRVKFFNLHFMHNQHLNEKWMRMELAGVV